MIINELSDKIKLLFTENKSEYTITDYQLFENFKDYLNKGKIRAANYKNEQWVVNDWVKQGILVGFKMGKIKVFNIGESTFTDKHTYPLRTFSDSDRIRLVPGGSAVRDGAFIGNNVTIMPPAYLNVGAYVDDNSMIDSHSLVGSCAQVGKNVHLSAGSMLGGVLEPINAKPVIIEDNVFIGGNCGIYEGVLIKQSAVIAAGVILTSGTPVFDAVNNRFIKKDESYNALIIPEKAVIVAGSRALKSNNDISIYCPVIIKYRDSKTDTSVQLEQLLR
ncbi:MAG: 2,3,4,5-tetrahydropyridine-2,6-dicarboxylate N-succinyltransferase [Candidatus Cloacimonetes bacterium]|nr:2,3,4,5-tetrahydropyridine-2,6-dicarboxylate N-succinyltransferase [Candidatus Cloacimonadota bacterium]MDD4155619.1 2,3,4,5-tetrahydropyridine-2,6-dicarboxylate N-succinyltransferase [Candidatus Cloacimonadota bacterium]